jgi:hypothetical protein
MPAPGTCFQLRGYGNHLWVVVSRADTDGFVLAVNVTDEKNEPESPCKLSPGDHEFVDKPSVICYRRARLISAIKLDEHLRFEGHVRGLKPVSLELLDRIVSGGKVSDDLAPKFLRYLQ